MNWPSPPVSRHWQGCSLLYFRKTKRLTRKPNTHPCCKISIQKEVALRLPILKPTRLHDRKQAEITSSLQNGRTFHPDIIRSPRLYERKKYTTMGFHFTWKPLRATKSLRMSLVPSKIRKILRSLITLSTPASYGKHIHKDDDLLLVLYSKEFRTFYL